MPFGSMLAILHKISKMWFCAVKTLRLNRVSDNLTGQKTRLNDVKDHTCFLGKKEMITIIQERFNVCQNIQDSNDHTKKFKTCYCFLLLFCFVFVRKHGDVDDQTKNPIYWVKRMKYINDHTGGHSKLFRRLFPPGKKQCLP